MTLDILRAGELHAPVLAALHARCFETPWSAKAFAALLGQPVNLALMARVANIGAAEPAGFILCRSAAGEAEVVTIGVVPDHRRAGIGRALLDDALARLATAGATRVFLEVDVANAAAGSLYAGRGFVEISRREGYYAGPNGRRDARVMALDLSPA